MQSRQILIFFGAIFSTDSNSRTWCIILMLVFQAFIKYICIASFLRPYVAFSSDSWTWWVPWTKGLFGECCKIINKTFDFIFAPISQSCLPILQSCLPISQIWSWHRLDIWICMFFIFFFINIFSYVLFLGRILEVVNPGIEYMCTEVSFYW